MVKQWLVVGISGTTCSGKTSLAQNLLKKFPGSIYICQDHYFYPVDSKHHTWVKELGHINWEIMSALDMEQMHADVQSILSQNPSSLVLPKTAKQSETTSEAECKTTFSNILILEGFLLLNDPVLSNLCDLRYFLTLTRDQCWDRRRNRVYDPADVPGYFDMVVWPEHIKHRDVVSSMNNVRMMDGMLCINDILNSVALEIQTALNTRM